MENNEIYFLLDYNWEVGLLVKTNRKTFSIEMTFPGMLPQIRKVAKDKCALPDEEVCVVWETWKGKNGRGGYRVERNKYPKQRIPARMVARQPAGQLGRVVE